MMDDSERITGLDDPAEAIDAEVAATAASRAGSSSRQALARAGLIVTSLFLASRVLGYVRTIAIAGSVPTTAQLDPFFAAFRIPDFLFQLVAAGALSSAIIPVLAALLAKDEEARAWRVVSTVSTLVLSGLLVLAAIVLLFTPQLVAAMTPGFGPVQLEQTIGLTRIMVLSPIFLAAGAIATSVLNSRGRFAAAGLAPLVYNGAIILGAMFLVPVFGIDGLAYGVVLGAAGHLLVQAPSVWRLGARIVPRVDLRDPEARLTLRLMAPRALGLGATQVVFLVLTSLATTLGNSALTEFNFAFALLQIPIGVIGVPLGVVLLPSLAREAALGNFVTFRHLLVRGLSILAFVMIAIAALGIVVSEDVFRLLFGIAHLSEEVIEETSLMLAVFLVGLTAHSLIAVLARAFYALQDTKTPVLAALLSVGVNIVAANALVDALGVQALPAAIAFAAWIECLTLILLLKRRLPELALGHVAVVFAKSVVACGLGAAVTYVVDRALLDAWGEAPGFLLLLVRLTLATAAGGAVILVAARALRIGELGTIVEVVLDLLRRRGRA